MNKLEEDNKLLLAALVAIIGSSDKEELQFMKDFILSQKIPEQDKTAMGNGISLLLEFL